MQNRYNFVLDQIWDCILPGYEDYLNRISWWLGEKGRVNPPMISLQEMKITLRGYSGFSIVSSPKGRIIRANIGPNIFHVTSFDSLTDIAHKGLQPTLGDRDPSCKLPPREAIFLGKSPSYAACICGKAKDLDNQVILEIEKRGLKLHKVNSMGHDLGLINEEYDLSGQLGSYEPIEARKILGVYFDVRTPHEFPILLTDRSFPVNVKLPCDLERENKNTWTRAIAEKKKQY